MNNLSIINDFNETNETIFGRDKNTDGIVIFSPDSRINKNIAVVGPSGAGKTRCFILNYILQCAKRNESIIAADYNGELYSATASFLKNKGYTVRALNLKDFKYSDSCNCLKEIVSNPNKIEDDIQTFIEIIDKNTNYMGEKSIYWDNVEETLLKALLSFAFETDYKDKTLIGIEDLLTLTMTSLDELSKKFEQLPEDSLSRKYWDEFIVNSDKIKFSASMSLGLKLHALQDKDIADILTKEDIDLQLPGREKVAIFVVLPEENTKLEFLSSLFFNNAYFKIGNLGDLNKPREKCKVPVNFILDAFYNIGAIPNLGTTIPQGYECNIKTVISFQSVCQIQNIYPSYIGMDILDDFDTIMFMGGNEINTINWAVKKSGLTADDLINLPVDNSIVITQGGEPLSVVKMDYSNHLDYPLLVKSSINDYLPE